MTFLAVVLAIGVILLAAAFFVGREAARLATAPPPPTYSLDEAYEWVVQHVPDDVAATLTPDDVKRIIGFQLEYFKKRGVAVNGVKPHMDAPVIVGGAETVAYILERSEATGESYLPEQVHAVVETQLAYMRAIGAVGAPAPPPPPPADPPTPTDPPDPSPDPPRS